MSEQLPKLKLCTMRELQFVLDGDAHTVNQSRRGEALTRTQSWDGTVEAALAPTADAAALKLAATIRRLFQSEDSAVLNSLTFSMNISDFNEDGRGWIRGGGITGYYNVNTGLPRR